MQVGEQLHAKVCELAVVRLDHAFADRVDHHTALRRVLDEEIPWLTFVVACHLIEVTFKHCRKFSREDLVLALIGCNLHHLYQLRCRILFDLEDKKAYRVRYEVIFGTGEPLNLQELLLSEVKYLDLALYQELDVVLGLGCCISSWLLLDSREFNVNLGVV